MTTTRPDFMASATRNRAELCEGESTTLSSQSVQPLKGIAPYVGGKRLLSAELVKIIKAIPHDSYVEPFVGMGGVFFRRRQKARCEVVNDLSGDVATLFRILQRHYLPFVEMLRWQLTTRSEFERLVATDPTTLTDLERAARFFYLQKNAFGGKVTGRAFGVDPGNRPAFDVTRIIPELEAYHLRLSGVVIERLPYHELIPLYDRPETLFFIDPPYLGTEHFYGKGMFGRPDFERLAGLLRTLKGRFVMTLNDCPEARSIFAGLKLNSRGLHYGVGGGAKKARELIIQGGK